MKETETALNPPSSEMEKIISVYQKTIELPRQPSPALLLCPVGPVGAGKTTVLKPLSRKLSVVRVETDALRQLLKRRGYGYDRAKEMTFTLAERYVAQGYGVAIDANCGLAPAQRSIQRLAKRYGFKPIWLRVNPPEQFIIDKLKHYQHTWLFTDWRHALANYRRTKKHFQDGPITFSYTFDPSRRDRPAQITQAARFILEQNQPRPLAQRKK